MKIAVDAMGGDFAPQSIVEGAVLAAKEYGIKVLLVGDEDQVSKELSKYPTSNRRRESESHAPGPRHAARGQSRRGNHS